VNLARLLETLPPVGLDGLPFPRHLLGAFRRKSITFCTGLTDERSVVYWFQSRGLTIDLRLPDGAATPLTQRQGWCGDTLWDEARQHLSWRIPRSYQPHDQWPEPARLDFIGNCVLEYAPSGAYVEDWRQQCTVGPLLGLRLVSLRDETSGRSFAMEGGFILAGPHRAYAQSRLPDVDDALRRAGSLDQALSQRLVTERDVESHEVSVALDGEAITHSTQPHQLGRTIAQGDITIAPDGGVLMDRLVGGVACRLRFTVDVHVPAFAFGVHTVATPEAQEWMQREQTHLDRHARFTR
jgi:hypothetical protein